MSPRTQQPTLACETCKSRKKKCDKALPKCALCTRKGLACEYPDVESRAPRGRPHASPQSTNSSIAISGPRTVTAEFSPPLNSFPPVFYLDWSIFQQCQVEIPKPTLHFPPNISKLVGNVENWEVIAAEYFQTTHDWMPIISKKSFYEHIHASSGQIRSDYALLLLAMDLICWVPESNDPRTPAYIAAKSFYLDLEIQGLVSLQILQAAILIALFEFGHAIFPSAAVSVEACVRYGCVLGIDWDAKFPAKRPFSWVELDEQIRAWWAVVILDRVLRIGYLGRPFLTKDPSPEAVLPADDKAWDEGLMPPKCFSVAESRNPRTMGRFALKAEATRLLGKVIKHIEAPTLGETFHDEEGLLLDRVLRALVTVVEFEGQNHNIDVMNQTLICSIALTMLHEAHASRNVATSEYFDRIHHTKHLTKQVAKSREEMSSQSFQTSFQSCVKAASPFMTTLLYQIATANLRRCQFLRTNESLESLEVMKATLKDFDGRWKASGVYLQILEAKEVSITR